MSKTTKAVILARGLGKRMREQASGAPVSAAADAGAKGMIDIGRPFLDYVISALADAGATDVCLVIGPEHNIFRDYYDSLETSRVRIHYAVQAEPLGTADAVAAAEEFAGEDSFLVVNSDNYYPPSALKELADVPGAGLIGFDRAALVAKSNIPAERVAAFALVEVDGDSKMVDIVEKPSEEEMARLGDSAPASMNAWKFTPAIFAACKVIEKSVRGEYEITDAVRRAIADGTPFTVVSAAVGVLDMSRRTDIEAVRDALAGTEVEL
ncbi:MAG: nucleotidyltransferase family protein [Buchananella hordeovulneris]|nr:nucleotidyltransferase family protein [Buchananella hordeovulneris]